MEFVVELQIEDQSQKHTAQLSGYGGDGGSDRSHFRETKQAKDQDRVKDNVDDRAGSLRNHDEQGFSRGLKQTLKGDLHKNTYAESTDDNHILNAELVDFRDVYKRQRLHRW